MWFVGSDQIFEGDLLNYKIMTGKIESVGTPIIWVKTSAASTHGTSYKKHLYKTKRGATNFFIRSLKARIIKSERNIEKVKKVIKSLT